MLELIHKILNLGGVLEPINGSKTVIGLVLQQVGSYLKANPEYSAVGEVIEGVATCLVAGGVVDKGVKVAIKE